MTTRADLVRSRIAALQDLLRERGADSLLLNARHDFAWLTLGGLNHILFTTETGVAPVLVTRDDAMVLAPVNEIERIADEELAGLPIRAEKTPWWPTDPPGKPLSAADVAEELELLRTALHPIEHERMAALARIVQGTCDVVLSAIRPGRTTEDDVIADASAAFARRGVRLPVILIAADERIDRYRHPLSAGKTIERRVMLVVCAERYGLIVAHTQFVELDDPTPALRAAADATASVLGAMRDSTRPGNTFDHVLRAAQGAYAALGVPDEWRLHHQGGSIGYRARERVATPGDQTVIRAGMAFAWNPSVVGHKREETLYLDSGGGQHVLTTTL